jgi:UDP-N-acetylmuramyl pentapeptide synthase
MAKDICREGAGYSFKLETPEGTIQLRLPLAGRFNIYNALAAAAVGYFFKVPLHEIRDGLEQVTPFDKRMQLIKLGNGVTLLNDTYNANPESMSSAIDTLCTLKGEGRSIAVLGDMLELGAHGLGAHQDVGKQVARSQLTYLFVTGDFAHITAQSAVDAGMKPDRVLMGSHEEIVHILKEILLPHDWILVKGSRGMAMEKIADALVSLYGNPQIQTQNPERN